MKEYWNDGGAGADPKPNSPIFPYSNIPVFQYSNIPALQHSDIPLFPFWPDGAEKRVIR